MTSATFKIRERFRPSGAGDVLDVVLLAVELVLIVFLLIVGQLLNRGHRALAPPLAHALAAPNAVLNRTDLIYGSQIGAWDMYGGPVASNPVAFRNAKAAGIRVVRFQMFNRPTALGGTESTAAFDSALATIHRLGAIPLIGLPPNSGRQLPSGPQPWSYAWQQWVVAHAAAKGAVLFEMANEPNNPSYGGLTPAQYFHEYWVNVPKLKAYARSLGYQIYVGGPAWMNWSAPASLSQVEQFLTLAKRAYLSTHNIDWIPSFVSVHCYGGGPNTGGQAQINAWGRRFDKLRAWINANMPFGKQIRLANTEYAYAIQANEGTVWQNQAAMTAYYNAMFAMARARTVDGSQRLWMMNQFCIDSGNSGLDLLNTGGTVRPAYIAFRANATAARSSGK